MHVNDSLGEQAGDGLLPFSDIYAAAVYGIIAPHIDTIMIDGEVVLSDGIVIGVDEQQLVEKAAEVQTAVLTRALERHPDLSRSLTWSTNN